MHPPSVVVCALEEKKKKMTKEIEKYYTTNDRW